MTTGLITHKACVEHVTPNRHPESPARLRAIWQALEADEFDGLLRTEAPRADTALLELVHPRSMIDAILEQVPAAGGEKTVQLDPDTHVSSGSGEAALRAAGANIKAVDMVLSGEVDNAFCAVRPPGHHAEPQRAMGFCLFANAGIGAAHARKAHGLDRVAVMDFDVHHGNGTQAFFESDPGYFLASTHEWPNYPGTGRPDEKGQFGNICNATLAPGQGSAEFRETMETTVLPAIEAFDPQLLIISAGFDAHSADPLAGLRLETADYVWATERLMELAKKTCNGRIVSTLEGGYDLDALAQSVAAHVRTLMKRG